MVLMKLPEIRIEPHLEEDERVLWRGQPDPWKMATFWDQQKNLIWAALIIVSSVGMCLFLLYLIVKDFGFFISHFFNDIVGALYFLSFPFWLYLGILLARPFFESYFMGLRTRIALTNRRMLIVRGAELEIYPLVLTGEPGTELRRDKIEARGGWNMKQVEFDGKLLLLPQDFWYIDDIEPVKTLLLNYFENQQRVLHDPEKSLGGL